MNDKDNNDRDRISSDLYPIRSTRYMRYRDRLLKNGFSEAELRNGHFYIQATEQTAFVINLYDEEDGLTVLYGFASTAYPKGDEDWFARNGSFEDSCQVRNTLYISDDQSEILADASVSQFYARYKDYPKDEILRLKKERQKEFLERFSHALKPLGFKKKNTRWTKALCDGTALSFEAQKSAFSDQYYFNVIVHHVSDVYDRQSFQRVVIDKNGIYNWQLMTDEQIEHLIQVSLTEFIIPKLEKTGLP